MSFCHPTNHYRYELRCHAHRVWTYVFGPLGLDLCILTVLNVLARTYIFDEAGLHPEPYTNILHLTSRLNKKGLMDPKTAKPQCVGQ